MNTTTLTFAASAVLLATIPVAASGAPSLVYKVRQLEGNTFIHIGNTDLCGTEVFKIDGAAPGAKQMLAVALTAFAAGKRVQVEVAPDKDNKPVCEGWGTPLFGISVDQ